MSSYPPMSHESSEVVQKAPTYSAGVCCNCTGWVSCLESLRMQTNFFFLCKCCLFKGILWALWLHIVCLGFYLYFTFTHLVVCAATHPWFTAFFLKLQHCSFMPPPINEIVCMHICSNSHSMLIILCVDAWLHFIRVKYEKFISQFSHISED